MFLEIYSKGDIMKVMSSVTPSCPGAWGYQEHLQVDLLSDLKSGGSVKSTCWIDRCKHLWGNNLYSFCSFG